MKLRWRSILLAIAALAAGVAGAAIWVEWRDPVDPAATHAIPPFTVPPRAPEVAYERFFALGDTGTGEWGQRRVARAMRDAKGNDGLDFMLLLGDNFYPDGVATTDDPKWEDYVVEPYRPLGVPIYPSLGNHDYRGRVEAQVERSSVDPMWRMPAAHYTFTRTLADGTRVQFWALDTTPICDPDYNADAQLAWLEQSLHSVEAEWKVVFGHHPVFSNADRGDNEHMLRRVEPLLTRFHVDLYLAGHDHHLEMQGPVDGVRYVISGGGAATDNATAFQWIEPGTVYGATRGGFVAVRVARHEMLIEFVRPDGETEFATSWRK